MIRVLQVFGEPLSDGGQESFIMNMYRNIDKEKIQFDFYTPFFCDNKRLKNEIKGLGGNVYASNGRFEKEGVKKDFITGLKNFLNEHKYEVIHINSGSIFNLAFGAKIAKKSGAKKIIVHSHATGINNIKYKIIKHFSAKIFLSNVTDYLACSKDAAIWKFPKKIIKNNEFTVIKNGIELEKYVYNENVRKEYRSLFKISEDEFVIGHIGRFEEPKNHVFLINLYEEILKKDSNTRLLLIGHGTLKETIKQILREKDIIDKVIFLERREDINNILQAMDIFVFPSTFEGLGIVTIEAQTAGLVTICSNNIPEEANVTELFYKMDLNEDIEKWRDLILSFKDKKIDRHNKDDIVRKSGYDAKESANRLLEIYKNSIYD